MSTKQASMIGIAMLLIGALLGFAITLSVELTIVDARYSAVLSGIIGATVAAAISLIGVIAANQSSVERLIKQHELDAVESARQREHDAKQKEEDRKAAIRREVYTKGVEEAHGILSAISSLPEIPAGDPIRDAQPLQNFLKANSKVWLVAESEAAHLTRELANLMGEVYLEAIRGSHPLRMAREPIRETERHITTAENELQRIQIKYAELQEQNADASLITATEASWSQTQDDLTLLKAKRIRLIEELRPRRYEHAISMFERMRPVQRVLVKLVSALRQELGLSPDEDQFLAELDDMEARAMAALNRAYGISPVQTPSTTP